MKKNLLPLLLFIGSTISAQVGVNTNNPQNTFHVDGGKDNALTGAPTSAQQANDVIITAPGNLGIGTIVPTTRLEINNGTTNGAIKIVDGTQGASKVLMSDANGVGTWQIPASIKPTVIGSFPSNSVSIASDGGSSPKYLSVYIDLTQGRWVINAGLTIFSYAGTRYWLHSYLSTSNTAVQQNGFTHLGPSGASTTYAGALTQSGTSGNDNVLNFLTGSSVINVTSATVRIYLLLENRPVNYWNYSTGSQENYFYAIPIN